MSGSISESEAGGNDWDDTWKPPLTSGINRKRDVTFTWHTPWKKVEVFLITPDGQRDNISDEAAHFQPIKLQYLLTNCLEKLQNLIYRIPFINVKSFMSGVELLEISLKSIPHPGIQAEIAAVLSNETEDVFFKMIPRRPFTCSIAEEIFKEHVVDGKLIIVRDDFQVYVVGRSNFKHLICSAIDQFNDLTLSKTITFDKRWKSVATVRFQIVSSLSEKFSDVLVRHDDDAKTVLINGRNTDVQNVVQEVNRMISSLYVEFFPIDHLLSELLLCDEASRLLTSVFKKLEIQLFWTIENANLFVFGKEVIPKDDVQMMISQTFMQVGFDKTSDKGFIDSNVFNDIIEKHKNALLVMKTNTMGVVIASTKPIVRVLLQLDHAYNETDVKSVQVNQLHRDMHELLTKNSELENNVQMLKVSIQHRDALAEIENFNMKSNASRVPQDHRKFGPATQKLGLPAGNTKFTETVYGDQMPVNDPSRSPAMASDSEDEDMRESLNNLDAEITKPWDQFHLLFQCQAKKSQNPDLIFRMDNNRLQLLPVKMQYLWLCKKENAIEFLMVKGKEFSFNVLQCRLENKSLIFECDPHDRDLKDSIESDLYQIIVPCVKDLEGKVNFIQAFQKSMIHDPHIVLKAMIEQGTIAVFHDKDVIYIAGIVEREQILALLMKKIPSRKEIPLDYHLVLLHEQFDFKNYLGQRDLKVKVEYEKSNGCKIILSADSSNDIPKAEQCLQEFNKRFTFCDIPLESELHAKLLNVGPVQHYIKDECDAHKIRGVLTVSEANERATFYFEMDDKESPSFIQDLLPYLFVKKVYRKRFDQFISTPIFHYFIKNHLGKDLVFRDEKSQLILVMLKPVENQLNELEAESRKKPSEPQPSASPKEGVQHDDPKVQQNDNSKEADEQNGVLEATDSQDVQKYILLSKFDFPICITKRRANAKVTVSGYKVHFSGISSRDLINEINNFIEIGLCSKVCKDLPEQVLKFVKRADVAEYVDVCLKYAKCHWFVDESLTALKMFTKDKDELALVDLIFGKSILWKEYGNTPDLQKILDDPNMKRLFTKANGRIVIEGLKMDEVLIIGTAEIFNEFRQLYDRIKADQIPGNRSHYPSQPETKQFLGINHDVLNYFRCFKSKKWNAMLNMFSVKADVDGNGEVFLSGDVENVKKAAEEFHKNPSFLKMKWSCNVVYPDEVVNKLSKTKHSIENEFHCTLAVEKDSSFVFQQQLCQIVNWRSGTHVVLVDAHAHEMAADAVVVPINDNYSPSRSGFLLLEKGGEIMQTDFAKRRITSKQIFISQCAGSLPFQRVAYLAIPQYKHGTEMQSTVLTNLKEMLESVDRALLQSLVIPVNVLDHIPETTFLHWFCSAFESVYEHFESLKQVFLCTKFTDETKGLFQVLKDRLTYNQNQRHMICYDFHAMFESAAPKGQKESTDIVVNLVKGNLVEQKVDVIVNSCNIKLDLKQGPVSNSILLKGGSEIQKECSENYPNGIDFGLPIKTTAGRMDYKFVLHGALPCWISSASFSSQLLQKLVFECLTITGKEKCSSIAFPVFGTGNLQYPWDEVARVMIDTVQKYGRLAAGRTTLKEVTIVLYEGDPKSIKAFEERKRISEEVILVPEDIAPPSPVIFESRCDNARVQVVSLQDVSCHQCEALVTIKSFQEVIGMERNKDVIHKSLKTDGIYTEKKTDARWWSIYISSDKMGFESTVTKALKFAAQERLSSLAICMKNPKEIELSYKRQATYVKEAVIRNEEKQYLMVVKIICPEIEEYEKMVSSTMSKQESESSSITSIYSGIFTGRNKHQWKLVNNIGCVQTP